MNKLSELIEKNLVLNEKKIVLGNILKVYINPRDFKINSFIISTSPYLGRIKCCNNISFKELLDTRVIINDFGSTFCHKNQINRNLISYLDLIDKKVLSEKGYEVGILKDFMFNMQNLKIEACILSRGTITDIWNGRLILPFIMKPKLVDNMIIVNDSCSEELIQKKNCLKHILMR